MTEASVERRLEEMLAEFTPGVAAVARAAVGRLRLRLAGAHILIYDGPNALAVGFGPSDRASDAVASIAVYPRWASLFFLKNGPRLPDPERLLRGGGTRARHIRLIDASDLDSGPIRALLEAALALADPPIVEGPPREPVVKQVSPNRRPRRPRG